jgi:hypothetical protein
MTAPTTGETAPTLDDLLAELARLEHELGPALKAQSLSGIDVPQTRKDLQELEKKAFAKLNHILDDLEKVRSLK